MKIERRSQNLRAVILLVASTVVVLGVNPWPCQMHAQPGPQQEPIAYIGHGAFFDRAGNELEITQAFVDKAQAWYRAKLLAGLDQAKKGEFAALEKNLLAGTETKGQSRLVVQNYELEWLLANAARNKDDDRTLGKLRALRYAMSWRLPEQPGQKFEKPEEFKLDPVIVHKLESMQLKPQGGLQVRTATTNQGQAYLNECMANQVPIPPTIGVMDPAGTAGWKSQGFIPIATQFIGQNSGPSPAEVRTYRSTSPAGMCYALPRYTDLTNTTVGLDGVICLSAVTSKACFWDNQMSGSRFFFTAGTHIPIGVPDTTIDPSGRYQAGGFELLGGSGGVCTDCHAGENPYITHPKADLGGGVLWESLRNVQGLPTFAPNRYDPLVAAAWPQNDLSQADPTVPPVCSACHQKFDAGRFPHLSNQLPGYCGTILTKGFQQTMPPPPPATNPGSQVAAGTAFRDAWCNAPPDSTSADAGDPHLITTNNIHYDFQSAGEFIALKNSDTGFELQTRQTPVQTSFTPPANPYTGLASCVSLNTAVAMRVGKHRVTYEPIPGTKGKPEEMQLRIDGRLASSASSPFHLGAGNVLRTILPSGLDVTTADGTALTVVPLFWSSEGYWHLDVSVQHTPAREGTMGPVLGGDWLPRSPKGDSFGPKPAALHDRHIVLNQKFADAWRVKMTNSLFDYATGTSTETFTDKNWPPESGQPCRTSLPSAPPLKSMQPELAKAACQGIRDKALYEDCIFDVTVMGDRSVARGYLALEKLRTTNPTQAQPPQ